MYKILILLTSAALASCANKHLVKVSQRTIEKPKLEFYMGNIYKPAIITEDKCYLMNSPNTPIICMLPSEYDKETRNYLTMLNIIKQYRVSNSYYNLVK